MAMSTTCQTSGAQFHTSISSASVEIRVDLPFNLDLTEEQAKILEANLHNVLELVLAPHFK